MNLINYLRLYKFRYHMSFITVIMGALVFADQPWYGLIVPLIILYLSFNVFLYGGLYTLNDIKDVESDSNHPKKKFRPLASKSISIPCAYVFAFTNIAAGLLVAYVCFGTVIFSMFLLFIAVNLMYTHIAKKIPYVEIFFNSLTHTMRLFLGMLLVTNMIPYLLLLAILLLAFGIASARRVLEKRFKGWEARKVLTHYTDKKLIIIQIIVFALIVATMVIGYPIYITLYIMIMLIYVVFVFGIYFSSYIANFYTWQFLN